MQTQIAVFQKGGSIGEIGTFHNGKKVVKTFGDDKEAAKEYAKRMRKCLSKGDRSYYGMGYTVGTCPITINVG